MNTLVLHFLWQTNSGMSIRPSAQTSTFNHQNQPPELATTDGTRQVVENTPDNPECTGITKGFREGVCRKFSMSLVSLWLTDETAPDD